MEEGASLPTFFLVDLGFRELVRSHSMVSVKFETINHQETVDGWLLKANKDSVT